MDEVDSPQMERRDFLSGALVGLGTGALATHLAQTTGAPGEQAPAAVGGPSAVPPDAPDAPVPAGPVIPPAPTIEQLGPGPPDGRRLSYAQQGEDLILRQLFESLELPRPRYLDIGAFHPSISSNTYLFYVLGARGVLVEPNPHMVALARAARPEDTVLKLGVGVDERAEADFYLIRSRPQLNTFSKQQADRYVAQSGAQAIEAVVQVPLRSVDSIIAEHFADGLDLLSLDVEGLDLAVLKSMDFAAHRPVAICVETKVYGELGIIGELIDLLRAKQYAIRGGTMVNTIFVDEHRLRAGGATAQRLSL